jgi:nucleotide-binding universal stress UspA family protein
VTLTGTEIARCISKVGKAKPKNRVAEAWRAIEHAASSASGAAQKLACHTPSQTRLGRLKELLMEPTHILIAVDDSEASERAVQYVAHVMRGNPDCQVLLLHVFEPMPPKLLEHGGAEEPTEEDRKERALDAAQTAWSEQAEQRAQAVFSQAQTMLRQARFPEHRIQTQIATPVPGHRLETCILETAKTHACGYGRGQS